MYRITLECHGVPPAAGEEAARDISNAFVCIIRTKTTFYVHLKWVS